MRRITRTATQQRAKLLGAPVRGHPRTHADALLAKLAEGLYALPEWGLVTEVWSHAGRGGPEVLRRLDGIARDLRRGDRCRLHGFEVKTRRPDWLVELSDPAKCSPFQLHCDAFHLVVPAPWKNVLLSLDELPRRWGLIEVGTGMPERVVLAEERQAEEPPPGLQLALFRAALARQREQEEQQGAPPQRIMRFLDRRHVVLGCGHLSLAPLGKVPPAFMPCFGCEEGRFTDFEYLEAALEDLRREDRQRLRALVVGAT